METTATARKVHVWDLPTRVFHWALLALVLVSWFTGEEENLALIHRLSGEAIAGLVVFRVIWGFVGGEYARFSSFIAGPDRIAAHLADMKSPAPRRWLGHNPLGGAAVMAMLATIAAIVFTGLFNDGEHNAGPFAGALGDIGEIHELLFRVLQGLVVIHVLGVVFETLKTKDALVPAMITGNKTRRADEAAKSAAKATLPAFLGALALGIGTTALLASLPVPEPSGEHDHEHGEHEDDD